MMLAAQWHPRQEQSDEATQGALSGLDRFASLDTPDDSRHYAEIAAMHAAPDIGAFAIFAAPRSASVSRY
jgi:hypothetical protein